MMGYLVISNVLYGLCCSEQQCRESTPFMRHCRLPKAFAAAGSTSMGTAFTCLLCALTCCLMLCCAVQIFDRPFLFFLVDETTQTVLFQGAVTDPSKSG
jgi:hypothetical protein